MTSQILIKLSDGLGLPGEKVAARLRRVAQLDGTLTNERPRDFRLPFGESRSLDVLPGRYVVETSWRTGDITYQDCLVSPDNYVQVEIHPAPSRRPPKASDRDFTRASAGGMFGRSSPALDEHAYSVFVSSGVSDSWQFVCDRDQIERRSSLSAEHQPALRSNDLTLKPQQGSDRNWVMYFGTDTWMVSSLPFDCRAEDEAVVLRSEPDTLPFIAVADVEMAVLVDMLPSGNSEVAHRYAVGASEELSSDALESMSIRRPLELCAFGYAECENFRDDKWFEILARTSRHQAWLSDISVILGWRALMKSRSEKDLDLAAQLLEHAVEVGVPYYSRGVKLLSEALSVLSEMRSVHSESARRVRSVAAKTIPTEAFTTVRV